MTELVLTSSKNRSLRPLVEAALRNELRILQAGIRRTEQRLESFEERYDLPSAVFIQRYENDELQETLDFAEWIGEYRLLERLREKADTLESVHIADRNLLPTRA
jgi:phage shock protein A